MKNVKKLPLLCVTHFLTDFVCTLLLTRYIKNVCSLRQTIILCALIYNGFAFAFQLPIGLFADYKRQCNKLMAAGCFAVALSAFCKNIYLLCIAAGIGNALFHSGGGKEVLELGGGKAEKVGKFVSFGTFGIFFGPLCAKSTAAFIAAPVLLAVCGSILIMQENTAYTYNGNTKFDKKVIFTVSLCMFITVFLRSYIGTLLNYGFKSYFWTALAFSVCIFGGKYFGGIFADKSGTVRFAVASQLACVALFAISFKYQYAGMAAVFLFNTTMAITANELYKLIPKLGGMFFGLTTFALYLGILPSLFTVPALQIPFWRLIISALLSAVFLTAGLIAARRGGEDV